MSAATTPEEFLVAFRWSNLWIGVIIVGLAWFVVASTRPSRRWLAWVATFGWSVSLALDVVAPRELSAALADAFSQLTLPWGEVVSVGRGTGGLHKLLADIGVASSLVLVVSAIVDSRRNTLRRTRLFGGILVFLVLGLLQASLVDFGVVRAPYLISYMFCSTVIVASFELAGEAARATVLSEEVRSSERRWRSLMEGVELFAVGCDRLGRVDFVNRYFGDVTGHRQEGVIGRSFATLIQEDDRENATRVAAGADSKTLARSGSALVKRDGELRRVAWSHVPMYGLDGEWCGTLNLGADVTDQLAAEVARDRAIDSLEDALARVDTLKARLEEENLYLKSEIALVEGSKSIIGESDGVKYVLHRVGQVADTNSTVLVLGETGVGKELVARAVHEASGRSGSPFIRVNCAALPASLIESELFGHERGAFTGADRQRKGRFELADGGTLFLDEIGELDLELQARLLRVLQEGEYERLGASTTRTADIRVIAATNRDLEQEVARGRFRRDLFYRLNVFPITVPPLRQRRDDIPLLVGHFVPRLAARLGRQLGEVPAAVVRELCAYDWPGNVRELRNVLERAVITSAGPSLVLPEALQSENGPPEVESRTLEEAERAHILEVLELTRGQVGGRRGAAEILGLPPSTLRSRMKKLGVRVARSAQAEASKGVTGRDISRRDDRRRHPGLGGATDPGGPGSV